MIRRSGTSIGLGRAFTGLALVWAVLLPWGLWTAATAGAAVPIGTVQPVPGTQDVLAVACSSPTVCLGAAVIPNGNPVFNQAGVFAITNGVPGPLHILAQPITLRDLSCPTPTTCVAVGLTYWNGAIPGTGWVVPITNGVAGTPVPVATTNELDSVSCPSATQCYAVGDDTFSNGVVVSIASGVPGPAVVVPGTGFLSGISCPNATTCEAVGHSTGANSPPVFLPIVNGTPGAVHQDRAAQWLTAIACTSVGHCLATGWVPVGQLGAEGAIVPITNGAAGAPQPVVRTVLIDIACPNASLCYAVGAIVTQGVRQGGLVVVTNGIAGPAQAISGTDQLSAVACATTALCEASGPTSFFRPTGMVVTIGAGTISCTVTGVIAGPRSSSR